MKELSARYPIWLCDVWGVVHNGVAPIASAVDALQRHRRAGGKVIFITNAPRPRNTIYKQLDRIGVPRDSNNTMITSGDVTRSLMAEFGNKGLYHLGPDYDRSIFEGVPVQSVALEQAGAVLCTGLFHEQTETAEDYRAIFDQMLQRDLPMICANPDKVVRKGDHLVPCAGALAEAYETMGGKVLMAGKPFAPIYEAALKLAGTQDRNLALAIGDGPDTDIKGATENGFAAVFVTGGINTEKDIVAKTEVKYPAAKIVASMPELYWF